MPADRLNPQPTRDAEPRVDVREERETPRGWSYRVLVRLGAQPATEHRISLSWVDHQHYCGGTQPPSTTVELVVAALLEAIDHHALARTLPREFGTALPSRFDISLARRMVPGLDATLRKAS
ncbi:MAG TPA: hypothetical protein VF777_07110 [Phycisphaerales bacterium]